ncbi:MAG: hypothetical protein GX896_03710 [Clostridiales bacterium]|nr:hypothetical protein [Clostridiales bacterium]
MKSIIVMGSMEFFRNLVASLREEHCLSIVSKSTLKLKSGEDNIYLIYGLDFGSIACEKAVLLFDETFKSYSGKLKINKSVGGVLGKNTNAVAFLKNAKIPVVTIGVSPKSTITYSGFQTDSLAVALQRTVVTIEGSEIDPFEYPMPIPFNEDVYQVLAKFFIKLEYNMLDFSDNTAP